MRFRCTAAATLTLASLLAPAAHAQWRQDGHDAAKRFANTSETRLTRANVAQLAPRWQQQVGQFYASPATASGARLILCSNLHGALAQSPEGGQLLWEQAGAGVGNCGTPALDEGGGRAQALLVSSRFGTPYRNMLSAVDQATGALRWSVDLPAGTDYLGLGYGPALHDGRVYATTHRRAVLALDAADGHLRWQASTGGEGVLNNDPAVGQGRVFVSTWLECCGNGPRQLFAFNAKSGKLAWQRDVDASNMQYPALVLGHSVVVGSDSGRVSAFDAKTGAPKWTRQLQGYVSSPLAGEGQHVYAASGNRDLQALDLATGTPRWTRTLGGSHQVSSNLAWANGLLYFTTQDFQGNQRLMVLDARNGKPAATIGLSLRGAWSKLTVADGQVLLSTDGQVTLLGL